MDGQDLATISHSRYAFVSGLVLDTICRKSIYAHFELRLSMLVGTRMADITQYLPVKMKHLQHSKLFKSLEQALAPFIANKIVDTRFISKLVDVFALEFEQSFDKPPVSANILELSDNSAIINYRFDRGYWEVVVPQTTVMLTDQATGTTTFFRESVDVSIEGSGGALRKGKRKSESIKRAHSRQVAKDTRYRAKSDDESDYDDEDGDAEWKP